MCENAETDAERNWWLAQESDAHMQHELKAAGINGVAFYQNQTESLVQAMKRLEFFFLFNSQGCRRG